MTFRYRGRSKDLVPHPIIGVMGDGETYGAAIVDGPCAAELKVIFSKDDNHPSWEHVSVSLAKRPPNWKEMCFIKELFWGEDDLVVQYHPPKQDYVNRHEMCLHLWACPDVEIPMPPKVYV